MSRRDENIELWTEAVESQIPNWSLKTSVGAIFTMATVTFLTWLSILLITTPLTIDEVTKGEISVVLLSDLPEFSYYIFSMAVAVCLTRYIWYLYQSPNVIASDVDIVTPPIIVFFIGGIILIFLSILNSILDPDIESVITLYFVSSYGLLGILGVYLSSPMYVKNNELPKDLEEYKEELKDPSEDDIIVLSSVTSFNAIVTTLITSVGILFLFYIGTDDMLITSIIEGNLQADWFFAIDKLGYFIVSVIIGTTASVAIWYIYSLPDQIASEIELRRVFAMTTVIGGFLIITVVVLSSLIGVSEELLQIYSIGVYVTMVFVGTAMSSVSFHKQNIRSILDDHKSDIYEAQKRHKELVQEYELLESRSPEAVTVSLNSDKLGPFGDPDTEKAIKRNDQIREIVEEYREKIRKHTEITDGLEEVESELNSASAFLSDSEFLTSSDHIETVESRLTELSELASESDFGECGKQISNLQQQKDALLAELQDEAREYVEEEIASIESEIDTIETHIKQENNTDANETIAEIETRLDDAREIATYFNFEGLNDKIESLVRRREAVIKDLGTDISVNEALSTLRSRLDRAESTIEEGEFERASDLLLDCDTHIHSIKQSFDDSAYMEDQLSADFDDVIQQHQQRYEDLRSELKDQKRNQLETKYQSIQSEVEIAERHLSEGAPSEANSKISDIKEQLSLLQEGTSQNELPDLNTEIDSLISRCDQIQDAVTVAELHQDIKQHILPRLEKTDSLLETERFTRTYQQLTTCRSRIHELDNVIAEFEDDRPGSAIDLTELLDLQLESYYTALKDKERKYVEAEINSIQSTFEKSGNHIQEGKFTEAREAIEEVSNIQKKSNKHPGESESKSWTTKSNRQFETRFERVRNVVMRAELNDYQETLDSLEEKQADLAEKINQLEDYSYEIESLQDDLDNISQINNDKEYETAKEKLAKFDDRLIKIKKELTSYETEVLNKEIATLRQRSEELIEDVEKGQRREELRTEILSLRSSLDDAQSLADNGSLDQAYNILTDSESEAQSLEKSVSGFNELETELLSVKKQLDEMLEEVTKRIENKTIPETIPQRANTAIEYELLSDKKHIGAGGNADVWKATHPASDGEVTVAIKEPRVNGTLHTSDVERMLDEAETWNKLDDHDHIVGVVDYGSEPLPWIAMEYMDGGHLGEYTDVEIEQKIWTAYVVTEGVLHAHRRGIVHLDLKPKNVLFRSIDNRWNVPKVSDWGLSKHLLEHSKSIEGLTVEYAAPEQFDDKYGATDDFTDVYQLGAVFYELFTGKPLYEGQPFAVMDRIKNEEPSPPSDVADVPTELDEILLTALSKEKTDRYSHVVYLRDALKELVTEF